MSPEVLAQAAAGLVAGGIVLLTQLMRDRLGIASERIPILSATLGIVTALAWNLFYGGSNDFLSVVLSGLGMSLTANGIYDHGKVIMNFHAAEPPEAGAAP